MPLLRTLEHKFIVHTTNAPGHAGQLARDILASASGGDARVKVVLAGGDGTTHEFLSGLLDPTKDTDKERETRWDIAVLPLGTVRSYSTLYYLYTHPQANALFYSLFPSQTNVSPSLPEHLKTAVDGLKDLETKHKLSSLLVLLSSSSNQRSAARPLPVTRTTLFNPDNTIAAIHHSHIVLSTSLHAALLSTSEELREEYPGLERFKIAAERNASVFFNARLKLLGGDDVRQYDPHSATFVEPFTIGSTDGKHELDGPFAYVLSTTLADRLEPSFQIVPTRTAGEPGTLDIIVLRPLRDPRVARAVQEGKPSETVRALWAKRAFEVISAAYANGAHVRRTYPPVASTESLDEEPGWETEDLGDGPVAVEVFRCAGFEWIPTLSESSEDGEKNRIVCADGSIHLVPSGGRASAEVLPLSAQGGGGFYVYGP